MDTKKLDELMEKYDIDVLFVTGSTRSSHLFYLTRGAHLGLAIFIKKKGKKPVLIYLDMERDNVSHLSEFELVPYSKLGLSKLSEIEDPVERGVKYYSRLIEEFRIAGRLAVMGDYLSQNTILVYDEIRRKFPDIELVKTRKDIIIELRRHKTREEIEKIKSVAQRTQEAIQELLEHMKSLPRRNGILEKKDGTPFTIGMARTFLRMELIKRGLLDSAGMIISQGRDAGVPHNYGNDEEPVKTSTTIIFDIFPQEYGGGYFFDLTRTYCFGKPPDEVLEFYEQVRYIQEEAVKQAVCDKSCKELEELVLDYFESKGHDTLRKKEKAQEGYVHSLGHGVGLDVHEAPAINRFSKDILEKGDVFTIEPGLYYPSKGFGIRIEDTLYIDEEGKTHNLGTLSKELVID